MRSEACLAATIEWDGRIHYGQGLHVDRGWKGRLGASILWVCTPTILWDLEKYVEGRTRLAVRGVMDLFSSVPMGRPCLYMWETHLANSSEQLHCK